MINKMGLTAKDRLLIINADDFGITEGSNEAIVNLFENKSITSASIINAYPASNNAMDVSIRKGIEYIGVHLTLTSSDLHPCTPVFQQQSLSSLITDEGYFHTDISLLEKNADEKEVRIELESQIRKSILKGIDPTHLDSHGGSVMGLLSGRDFLEVVFDLCEKYRLPFNLPKRILEQPFFNADQLKLFQKRMASAYDRKIVLIDDMVSLPYCSGPNLEYSRLKQQLIDILQRLKPGVTQLTVHPSILTDQLKEITHCYEEREMEYRLLQDDDVKRLIKREQIKLITWKAIRDLQRSI
ncbi:hypothetical protein A7K91_23930 [Paenibacillus oryzae]|uniref:ChbG/HpnK family deacetylase n=1 Tax=Paenibacillus oryzae TaxID=1844972 RepID=A0A1A5YCN0_9BACL|nr:polysaccharide deacetylase family protein [Paenibacillus oryzae]OBR63150.1 hypothetical protein A7K91_23930 [Paenibacillus oryzae]